MSLASMLVINRNKVTSKEAHQMRMMREDDHTLQVIAKWCDRSIGTVMRTGKRAA